MALLGRLGFHPIPQQRLLKGREVGCCVQGQQKVTGALTAGSNVLCPDHHGPPGTHQCPVPVWFLNTRCTCSVISQEYQPTQLLMLASRLSPPRPINQPEQDRQTEVVRIESAQGCMPRTAASCHHCTPGILPGGLAAARQPETGGLKGFSSRWGEGQVSCGWASQRPGAGSRSSLLQASQLWGVRWRKRTPADASSEHH